MQDIANNYAGHCKQLCNALQTIMQGILQTNAKYIVNNCAVRCKQLRTALQTTMQGIANHYARHYKQMRTEL